MRSLEREARAAFASEPEDAAQAPLWMRPSSRQQVITLCPPEFDHEAPTLPRASALPREHRTSAPPPVTVASPEAPPTGSFDAARAEAELRERLDALYAAEVERLQFEREQAVAEAIASARTEQAEALLELVVEAERARARAADGAEERLLELCSLIVRRVLGAELATPERALRALVDEALRLGASDGRLSVRVGSGFAPVLDVVGARLAERGLAAQLAHDPALRRFGCVVENEHGAVDQDVEARLTRVLEALGIGGGA